MNPIENPGVYRYYTLMERFCWSRLPVFNNPPSMISPPNRSSPRSSDYRSDPKAS